MDDKESTPQTSPIPNPNIKDGVLFQSWLEGIKTPFKGMEDKTHPDGRKYSVAEQIEATREQLRIVAEDFQKMGMPEDVINDHLIEVAKELRNQQDSE
jgi:hypothetical protein